VPTARLTNCSPTGWSSRDNPLTDTPTFETTLIDGERTAGVYRVTATDSLAATATADIPVTAFSTPVS
jgi:hypothetical protein